MMTKSSPKLLSIQIEGLQYFKIQDTSEQLLDNRRVRRILDRYHSFFISYADLVLRQDINYLQLLELIEKLNKVLIRIDAPKLDVDDEVIAYINQNKYAIREHRIAGETIKANDDRWQNEIYQFNKVLHVEISRPLKDEQVPASFFLATMKRAANFSVPGAGKTAMMYAAFAYLSSSEIDEVNRLLVISPINAFEAWRTEFIEVFGNKRVLNFMNLRDARYRDIGAIRTDWGVSNVIVVNYEALEGKLTILNELIDAKTMIVFDEVHRVKGISGRRSQAALALGKQASYHYVLTGTPIPNSYKDIYNFLHLLYDNEYDSFFGWDVNDLQNPNLEEVNERIYPFFWRTNKHDLRIPKADLDNILVVDPTVEQQQLVGAIYKNESNVLALFLRLLQASTNPALLLDKIDYQDLGFLDDEVNFNINGALDNEERELARQKAYQELNISSIRSSKFERGIELIMQLVNEGKKVVVWGMFVKTMQKIQKRLRERNVAVNIVYGGTPKDNRVNLINEFRDGDVEVLISNPNTLGESISLHSSVHDAVYFEYNFNLTFMLQSRDRIHRLGLPEGQYTRYYYLMSEGNRSHEGFIDKAVYRRLKEKEEVMLEAIDGTMLVPEVTDDYLDDIKRIILGT